MKHRDENAHALENRLFRLRVRPGKREPAPEVEEWEEDDDERS